MATVITTAFEHWNASQVMNGLTARPDNIIFAYIPGLDPVVDIDRTAGFPAAEYIVYQAPVTQYGLINENAVAYSVVLDTLVGDFDFNYLGLLHEESGTLCMVVHTLPQNKIATAAGQQGNSFTRTFLMEFNGAAESSQITVTAETWQIDYSARLAGIDESVRLTNLDYYGPAAFIGNGFKVTKDGEQYRVAAGVGYVGGLRVVLDEDVLIDKGDHLSIWLDVGLKGTVTGAHIPDVKILLADELIDYIDIAGQQHYVAKLAIENNATIEDVRPATPQEQMTSVLDEHARSRNHPAATLSQPGFVVLSSANDSDSETTSATSKAVKAAYDEARNALTVASNKVSSVNGKTGVVTLNSEDVGAISAYGGNYPVYLRMKGVETLPTEPAAANLSALYSSPSPINSNTIAAGVVHNWFYTQVIAGIIRNSSDGSSGYGIDINGVRKFQVDTLGNAYANGQQMATQAWSLQNNIQDVRLGAESNSSPGVHSAGYVATAYDSNNYQLTALYHRPLQKKINGVWFTVGAA